jgi:intracellular sulfur oxidation DsrE/DsrF family protein
MLNNQVSRYAAVVACMTALALPLTAGGADTAKSPGAVAGAKQRVIFQVSDNDPRKWNLALNNIRNVQEDLGKGNVEIELVAYGPGLPMLTLESEVSNRIADALAQGVNVVACENTMFNTKVKREDMLPNIGYVKAGVVELMVKQQQGYSYIRP